MLATALVLCAIGTAPRGASDVEAVVAVLERCRQGAPPGGRLPAALAALGAGALPDLFTVLASGSGLERPVEPAEEDALAEALASFGSPRLRPFLQGRLSREPAMEERLAALRVLARSGSSDDLGLVRLATHGAGPVFAGALQEACAGILRRDARALEALRRWMLEASLALGAAIARAVTESECPRALSALASTLGFRADLDAELLEQLALLIARAPKPVPEDDLHRIEDALERDDPRILRAATLALGHAQHAAALPRLIALLEHDSRGVSIAAEWALGNLTGLRFRADGERWRAWLRAEEAWLARNGERVHAELRDPAPRIVIRALGELGSHRWRRHELALDTAVALEHEDPLVRRLACLTLGRLGSSAAGPALTQALGDEDESVARAARQALEVLRLAPAEPDARALAIPAPASRNDPRRPRTRDA
jgi:HEAT repeat protein